MSGAVTAAVAAVGSLGLGAYAMSQQSGMASTQMGMSQTIFNEQQQYAQQLQQLIADPGSVTKLPGYQFQFQQGQDAVTAQMAAKGFLGSGNMGTALVDYGQEAAQSAYQQQVNVLGQLSGLMAPTSAGQFGQLANQSQQGSNNMLGGQLASLMYLGGATKNGTAPWSGMFSGPSFFPDAAANSAMQSMPGYLYGTPAMNPFVSGGGTGGGN